MKNISLNKFLVLFTHGLILWGLCGAVMGISMAKTSLEIALIIHVIAAPLVSISISSFYYWKFNYTTPFQTAVIFIAIVILMDSTIVAIVINKSFDMFGSFIGTWLPFILIFISTYLTGILRKKVIIKRESIKH